MKELFYFIGIFISSILICGNAQNYYNGQLGVSKNYFWTFSADEVNMGHPIAPEPQNVRITTESQIIKIDIHRSALIIIDMQNDFIGEGGWVDSLGGDWKKGRVAIDPLVKLIPEMRKAGIRIIWVNWGNRPDLMNMPPTLLWQSVYLSQGLNKKDMAYGKPNNYGSNILEKNSWGAEVVAELKAIMSKEDIFVDKYRYSGFWDTPLDSILRNLGIKTLFFTGVNTDQCVYHSLADAHFLGYGPVIIRDGVATISPEFTELATFWQVERSFGWITNSTDIIKGLSNIEK